ncbi:MAG TPA: GNAT family N-acetyltransferase [Anaerolineales bacterium]|nr:GNAT family N-acetyltransferase [Anaerolineales bacterium]
MKETTYTLHPYDHSFDAGLAQMWNESDHQWPGTFTDGVPFTEQTLAEWMDRLEAIIRFVVVEDGTGVVVGYGDLWDTAVRPKSCYVALLNVHPEHQGKSLARRMLVDMVDWSVANGYDRITIGTWPSNLKAMPLYKKVGFFWKPDTTVHMENYLPAVRMLPAAQDFFAHHSWYETYDRALDQVEDDMTHPGTGDNKVFVLRWRANGEMLETVFDRNAQALTGIETDAWAVYARTGEAEPAQGLTYPFEWEFRNKTDHPLRILAEARPDEGIRIALEEEVRLEPGEARVLATTFRVDLDAPRYRDDHEEIPTPRIRTQLEIDGQPLELGTGLRYRPAVEFSMHPEIVTLAPGRQGTIHLQLQSRTKKDLAGALKLEIPDGLAAEDLEPAFTVPAKGHAGIPVILTAERPGVYRLTASAEIEDAGNRFTTKEKVLAVAAVAPGGWAAGEGERELVLENDFFRVTAKAKGGEAVFWNKDADREDGRVMEEIGPAFIPWDLNELEYDLALETAGDAATAVMTVRSTRFPGLIVGREITVNGSPLVRVTSWVRNETGVPFPKLQVRPHIRIWSENRRMVVVPLSNGTVRAHGSQFGIAEEDFPKKPEDFAESWLAYDYQDRSFGFIWERDGIEKLDAEFGRHFFYYACPLEPGEIRRIEPYYLYSGPGDWHAVQEAWRRMQGAPTAAARRTAASPLDFRIDPQPLLVAGGEAEGTLRITSTRRFALNGAVELAAPEGWTIEPERLAFDVDRDRPVEAPVRLVPDGKVGAGVRSGMLRLRTQAFEREAEFRVIRLSDPQCEVAVEAGEAAGYATWQIDNGIASWTVVPGFHGGVTEWRTAGSETNHLFSPFPESGELSWMKPIFGGIRPVLAIDGEDGWPGKLHAEAFTAEPITAPDGRGLEWRGVRLTADIRAEKFRGLQVVLDYLTLPGSQVLKCVYRLSNRTPVHRPAQHGWLVFPSVDGDMSKAVLHTPDYIRQRTTITTWGVHDLWAAVSNPETGRTLAAVHASGHRRLLAMDLGDSGAHLFVREIVSVPPDGFVERIAFLALAGDASQARAYASLAG